MRVRALTAVGLGVAALVLTTLPPASASGPAAAPATASGFSASSPAAANSSGTAATRVSPNALKCGTGFGTTLPTPDGLIAWNDGSSFNISGGADVQCAGRKKKRTIHQVSVKGYFGATTETFHVTFWADSTSGGSSEPADSAAVTCSAWRARAW